MLYSRSSLTAWKLKPGPFNESHVAIVCRELLLGLDYLHREGKIHRDIKAANVLLAQSGKVKLADFGVAAQLTNIKSIRNTFVGTPFWMAPEVIQESGYDFKADIWSLGITAMELINGEPPNAAIHPMKVLFLIPKSPAPRLEGSQHSRELKDFVAACLVKDPDHRPTAEKLLQHRFIRNAGKVEGLQELILRKQMFDSRDGRESYPKYYEETLTAMSSVEEEDDWVFDTVKAPTIPMPKRTALRHKPSSSPRKPSSSSTLVDNTPENLMSKLTIEEKQAVHTQDTPPSTMRRLTTKRRASPSQLISPGKRKPSGQRKPLAPDMSFGNTGSTVRQFRRVSDNSPNLSPDGSLARTDENRPPVAETVTKEALVARRAYSKVVDLAFQETYAQTGNHAKREAISRAAQAWNALDLTDPEGEFNILKLILEKVQRFDSSLRAILHDILTQDRSDPKLSSLLPTSQPSTPQKPKLVLAQNNPHLKSHRRRQSSIMPIQDSSVESQLNLPGQVVPGMEHTKQLADVLYGKWADGLKNRWPIAP